MDLHIDQLIDTTAGMSNADVLEYQLQKFNEVMSEHRAQLKHQKIVFIHGKGDGVLKKAILSRLGKKYPTCFHQDASFQEYGYGAYCHGHNQVNNNYNYKYEEIYPFAQCDDPVVRM